MQFDDEKIEKLAKALGEFIVQYNEEVSAPELTLAFSRLMFDFGQSSGERATEAVLGFDTDTKRGYKV